MNEENDFTGLSEQPDSSTKVLLPFALAQPSRAIHAAVFSETLEPRKEKVRAFFEERGMWASQGEITLPGPTWSWKNVQYDTPLQTVATLNPPDWSPDSKDDEKPENQQDDETQRD
jgi:hypothetical protein